MKRSCKDCMYFKSYQNPNRPDKGECRLNPPLMDTERYFPDTLATLWCGKFVQNIRPQEDSL